MFDRVLPKSAFRGHRQWSHGTYEHKRMGRGAFLYLRHHLERPLHCHRIRKWNYAVSIPNGTELLGPMLARTRFLEGLVVA